MEVNPNLRHGVASGPSISRSSCALGTFVLLGFLGSGLLGSEILAFGILLIVDRDEISAAAAGLQGSFVGTTALRGCSWSAAVCVFFRPRWLSRFLCNPANRFTATSLGPGWVRLQRRSPTPPIPPRTHMANGATALRTFALDRVYGDSLRWESWCPEPHGACCCRRLAGRQTHSASPSRRPRSAT